MAESKGRIFVCDGRIRSGRPILTKTQKTAIVLKLGIAARHTDVFYEKWIRLRYSSKSRHAQCLLSFAEYMKLASRAGIDDPDMIGKGLDKFQMGRKKDLGDYVLGNCRFITQRQNQIELTKNGGRAVGDAKRSAILKGRTKETHEYLARSSEAKRGRTKETDSSVAAQANKVSKNFKLISPSGKIYKGRNLKEFAQTHGLKYHRLQKICGSLPHHYEGWKGTWLKQKGES